MRKSTVQGIVLAAISVCLTMLGLELAVRIHRGKVLHFQSSRSRWSWTHGIPSPAGLDSEARSIQLRDWTSNVDASSSEATADRSQLQVGLFSRSAIHSPSEMRWKIVRRGPAHLEEILNKRVLNAGVGAYGIDQAFLRAELLLDKYDPDVVILSFISDDINRTEYSYYPYGGGWKPYFEYGDGSLILRNFPVPQQPAPRGSHSFQTLRRALGYSFLANAVLDRIAPQWWHNVHHFERIHNDGENVSVDLLVRLDGLTKGRGGQFIAIALATNGRIGDNARLPNLVKRAREKGVDGFGPFNGSAEA